MPGVDAAAGTLVVLTGAAAAVFVVAILLAAERSGGVALTTSLFRVGLIAVAVLGAWLYVEQRAERRTFDQRKVLVVSSIASGPALSCLDGLAGEAVETACEKAVFASPEAVASAVKYVAAQIDLLNDGTAYAGRGDAGYAAELAPLQRAIQLDRFGLVAQVLGEREGCTVEHCDALARLRDSTRVLANLRDHAFEERVKKYTAIWNAARPAEGVVAADGPSVALPWANGPRILASPPRDPAAAVAPPVAPGSITPELQEPLPPRDPVAAEPPALQSAPLTPPAALGSVTPLPARDPATAEQPALQSAALTPTAALGSVTPLPRRRPSQVRAAPPP